MKAKEYIIQKLVDLGKKHKWMKYPMLALVSLISFFFLVLEKCMERPKRAVIALVCMVLIISQSWYLISIAEDPTGEGQPGTGNESGITDIMAVDDLADPDDSADPGDNAGEGTEPGDGTTATESETGSDVGNAKVTFVINNQSSYGGLTTLNPIPISNLTGGGTYTLPAVQTADPNCWAFTGWRIKNESGRPITELTKAILEADGTKSSSSENYTFYLYAECRRIAYRVTYEYNGSQVSEYAPTDAGGAIQLSSNDSLFFRSGFTYDGWYINGVQTAASYRKLGAAITLTDDITAIPAWVGNRYFIRFASGHATATGTMADQELRYRDPPLYEPLNLNEFKRVGYAFAGWQTVVSSSILADGAEVSNLSTTEDDVITMTATWQYDYAGLSKDSFDFDYTETVDADNGKVIVNHQNVGGGDFDVKLSGVQGTTLDGEVNKDNLVSVTGLDVLCSVLGDQNAIVFLTDSEGIRTVGEVVLSFEITDKNNVDDSGNPITVYRNITVRLHPKQLEITGVSNASKVYDGTSWIEVGDIRFTGAREGADLVVHSDKQSGYFTDPNVGTGKDITVNLSIYGNDAKYYRIKDDASEVTIPGEICNGTITKRPIGVTTAPVYPDGRDYYLTGEEPEYTSVIHVEDLPADLAATDETLILNAIKGNYTCDYKPNYSAGEFAVLIDTNRITLQNYSLTVTPGTLTVQQETPVERLDYTVEGQHMTDSAGKLWYWGENPRVVPTGVKGYNMVYLTNDPSAKAVTYDASRFRQEAYITEAMCSQNATLYVQLANSKTHAVTSMESLEVYVDTTAPVIDTDKIEITTVNTGTFGKIGNFLSFGNFFKESIMITIPVSDALSGANSLTYYLGGSIWETGVVIPVRDGKATITVPIKYKGTIALTARDNAGNSSTLADLIGVDGSTYWVVENEAPAIRAYAVDLEGKPAYSGEDLYYRAVKLTASVTDQDAGVAYVIWNITKDGQTIAEENKQVVSDTNRLLTSYDFERMFEESGAYTVSATAYDNAENMSLPTEVFRFSIDGTAPVVQVSPADYDESWGMEKVITFTVTDTESGMDMLTLLDDDNQPHPYTAVEGTANTYTFTVTRKGTYTIKATDRAGNVAEVPLEFTRVSSEVPDTPNIITNPAEPEHIETGWFTSNPEIRILEPDETTDGTMITTYYRLWEEGAEEPSDSQIVDGSFQLPKEGIWNIRAWAETESGMRSASDAVYRIGYDGTAPVISDIIIGGSGTASRVLIRVTEPASGLAKLQAVYNKQEDSARDLTFTYAGNGVYTAEFMAAMAGSYSVRATDAAGNTAYAEAFEPMNIVITRITGNVEEGMLVTGRVESGTFAVESLTVQYGLAAQEPATDAESLIVTTDADGNKAFTAKFTQLNADSQYRFLITAYTTTGEHCNYTGAFKTEIRRAEGISVAGTVLDETMRDGDDSAISVVLYSGNDIVQFQNVKNEEAFIFTNVPDGSYVVRAIHGNRSAGMGIVVRNGAVVEPTDSIRLVLRDGQSVSVEYGKPGTPSVSVSGLENIFDDTTNFGSDQDFAIINAGGVVEFCMEINGLSESEVPPSDMELIRRSLGNKERVASYMDFSIWKRNVGAFGIISQQQVSSIAGGKSVRLVIPLGADIAGRENLYVLRVHNGIVERLADLDSDPYTYTIESTLFSTYALVYTDNSITNTDSTGNGGGNGSGTGTGTGNGSGSGGQDGNGSGGTMTDIGRMPNSNGVVSASGTSPRTGDEMPVVWISMLGIIAAAAGTMLFKNKKNQ
ncbi:MAG: YDG domain-containing protein [Bacteroides sp.]|nr:YDG domain-containing protein [Bacteroides sp.]MCM1549206.1 YDG domain-containing protein [Clostridium sp.]